MEVLMSTVLRTANGQRFLQHSSSELGFLGYLIQDGMVNPTLVHVQDVVERVTTNEPMIAEIAKTQHIWNDEIGSFQKMSSKDRRAMMKYFAGFRQQAVNAESKIRELQNGLETLRVELQRNTEARHAAESQVAYWSSEATAAKGERQKLQDTLNDFQNRLSALRVG